mmetsp:Transcript_40434/g.92942  ORF Transcript_40434/g.92942 Transcript_40434/m.92942 type:complete len:386 (-) Transcript_40434:5014-6171(-)
MHIDNSHSRKELVLVILGTRDGTPRMGVGRLIVDVAHHNEIVKEWCCIDVVEEMVHMEAASTLNELVIIMEDVPSPIVEHALTASEGREGPEVVQNRRLMRWFQVPTVSTCMYAVVIEGQHCGAGGLDLPQSPTSNAARCHVVPVPAHEAWEPESRRHIIIVKEKMMRQRIDRQVVLKQSIVFVAHFREEAVAMCAHRNIVSNNGKVSGVHHNCALESVMVGIVAQVCLVHNISIAPHCQDVPMRRVSAKVCCLTCHCEFCVLNSHLSTEECANMSTVEIAVAWLQTAVFCLDLHRLCHQANCRSQVNRMNCFMVVPDAKVFVLQRLVKHDCVATIHNSGDMALLFTLATLTLSDNHPRANGPIDWLSHPKRPISSRHCLHQACP